MSEYFCFGLMTKPSQNKLNNRVITLLTDDSMDMDDFRVCRVLGVCGRIGGGYLVSQKMLSQNYRRSPNKV